MGLNITSILSIVSEYSSAIPQQYQILFKLFFFTLLIAIYSIFIFKFYRFLSRRDILRLNLKQYSKRKLFVVIFFIVEYILILPFALLFWFVILGLLLLILASQHSVNTILLIAAALIASTRITAYIDEDLSKDLAKLFPFTALTIFILERGFFNVPLTIQRFMMVPSFFSQILSYLAFIFLFEIVLRVVYTLAELVIS